MTHHFSDPLCASVHAAIVTAKAGVTYAELFAELPEEVPGELRAALQELRGRYLITSYGPRYFAAAAARSDGKKPMRPPKSISLPAVTAAINAPATSDAQPSTGDCPMTKSTKRGVQAAVLALVAEASGTPAEIAKRTKTMTAKQIGSSLYLLKKAGAIKVIGGNRLAQIYAVTSAGSAFTERSKAGPQNAPAKPAKRVVAVRAQVEASTAPATYRVEPGATGFQQGFRVGIFSDGSLSIIDADCEMQLDAVKTRALVTFLDQQLAGQLANDSTRNL